METMAHNQAGDYWPNATVVPYINGWTCQVCGVFVSYGMAHSCWNYGGVNTRKLPPIEYCSECLAYHLGGTPPCLPKELTQELQGWQCPACKKVYAPWWPSCDCEKDANYKKNR